MKTKYVLSFVLFIFCSVNIFGQAPNWQWAKTSSENSVSYGSSVCLDAAGNSYVTGWFNSPITFGNITLPFTNTQTQYSNLYLVKYDPWGNVLWAKKAGGGVITYNRAQCVAVDDFGNIFIAGTFGDTIVFGTTQLIHPNSSYGQGMFLAKFNSSGNVLWAKKMGGGDDQVRSVSTDGFGNSYVTGDYQASATDTFGNFILNNSDPSHHNLFIAKFDVSGNAVWARMASGSSGDIIGYSVKGDNAGNCYLAGSSGGAFEVDFGTNAIPCNNYRGTAFLVKFDANGYLLWARGSTGTADAVAHSVALDPSGHIYMTGYFFGTTTDSILSFGSIVINNTSHAYSVEDVFLVKYSASGNPLWATSGGGHVYNDVGNSVFADDNGNSYITGYFETQTIGFGTDTLTKIGYRDLFLVKYNPAGNVMWAKNVGENLSFDEGNSVAVDSAGNCFVAGEFMSPTINFDAVTLNGNANNYQMFIAKTSFFPLGINLSETSDNSISIFPNPFNSSTTIQFSSPVKNAELNIYNLYGQKLKSIKNISADKIEIDRDNLPDGIYFIQLTEQNKLIATQKIVIAD